MTSSPLSKTSRQALGWLLTLLLLLGAAPGAATAAAVTDDNAAQMLASAKTAEDHQALATYFRAQAADAAAKVAQHEAMLASMSGKPKESWRTHCQGLIKAYREQQKDYEALAQEQEKAAKSVGR